MSTIKEIYKANNVQLTCEAKPHRWGEVLVTFLDNNNALDETSFDIEYPLTMDGCKELTVLYNDFCKENGFQTNTVISITITSLTEIYEDLLIA